MKCPLHPSKSVEKEKRGFFDHRLDGLRVHSAMEGQQGRLPWFKF